MEASSLSKVSQVIFNTELTHLGSEASKYTSNVTERYNIEFKIAKILFSYNISKLNKNVRFLRKIKGSLSAFHVLRIFLLHREKKMQLVCGFKVTLQLMGLLSPR